MWIPFCCARRSCACCCGQLECEKGKHKHERLREFHEGFAGKPVLLQEGTTGAFRDVLSKDHARRGKPPLHFADMTEDERIAKAKDLGLPKFRVKQLANHYYGHFDVAAEEFSDFPAAKRAEAAEAFFPTLITEVTRQVADEALLSKRYGVCSTVLLLSPCSCGIPPAPPYAFPAR